MANLFYTLEEAAEKLGKSTDEVREMASSGQIEELNHDGQAVFKVSQIDLMAGGDDDLGDIALNLEDSATGADPFGLDDSAGGSAMGLEDSFAGAGAGDVDLGGTGIDLAGSNEATGISAFDTGAGSKALDDPLDLADSGAGSLDLTRESDETSLGAELLEDAYSTDDVDLPASASGLFDSPMGESAGNSASALGVGAIAATPMVIDEYDGTGSGLGAGAMIAAMVALVCVAIVGAAGVLSSGSGLASMFAGNFWVWTGGLLLVWIVCLVVGVLVGKATE